MKTKFRLLVGLAAFAVLALTALTPASAAPAGSYSATADGSALSLSISQGGASIVSIDAGVSHAELSSNPTASASGAGIVQIPESVAETDAPPDDSKTAAVLDQTIGDPSVAAVSAAVIRGIATSEVSGDPTATAVGEVLNASITAANLIGTTDWAVRTESSTVVDGATVTAEAHADEVMISLSLGDELINGLGVCELLDTLPLGLGDACRDAVEDVSPLARVITIRILPADVECVYDGNTETASVPVARAALLSVQVFDAEPVVVGEGQTLDLLDGTPLHIHAEIGTATTDVQGSSAAATATGLELELFEDALPQIRLAASDVSCGVAGQLPPEPPAVPRVPRGVTGAALPPIMLGAAALVLVGLGARRFARAS